MCTGSHLVSPPEMVTMSIIIDGDIKDPYIQNISILGGYTLLLIISVLMDPSGSFQQVVGTH